MNRMTLRKSDPITASFQQSPRFIVNERGVFYKVRGGKLNGPFRSEKDARYDLQVFKQVVAIEEQLDTENFKLFP